MRLAILYLAAITGAEVVTNLVNLVAGVICHTVILVSLIAQSSLSTKSSTRQFLLTLCLAPLTRILSLSMPLTQFSVVYWYLIIYPTLFLAGWVARHHLNFTAREIGLNIQKLPLQLVVVLSGVIFGITEHYLLRPEPIIPELTWGEALLPAFVLVFGTGFVEEFLFRGVIQRASIAALGRWGIPYVALLFAALHLIHYSTNPWDIPFVFIVGLFFGWVVNKTGSLLGVTLAHGVTNVSLYLILPFFF